MKTQTRSKNNTTNEFLNRTGLLSYNYALPLRTTAFSSIFHRVSREIWTSNNLSTSKAKSEQSRNSVQQFSSNFWTLRSVIVKKRNRSKVNRQRRNKWKAETHRPINNGHASRRAFLNRIIRTLNMLQLSSEHTLRPVTRLIILRLVLLSIPSRRRITIDLAHARVRLERAITDRKG